MKKSGPILHLKNGKFKINLSNEHREVLQHLIEQLRDSLMSANDDASLRRLFPTAYHNDASKDAEYQRLMRDELLASRLASTEIALLVIANQEEIDAESIDGFSRSINSMRLVIGTNLDISESDYNQSNENSTDGADDDLDDRDVQKELYEYLGWLLEWTVMAQSEGL